MARFRLSDMTHGLDIGCGLLLCRAALSTNPVWTAFEDGVHPNTRTGGPSGGASSLGSLATYALPSPRRRQRWLDETIRSAVLNIEQAPFLQATSTDPQPQLRRFHVAPEVGSAPQVRAGHHLVYLAMCRVCALVLYT